MRTSKRLVLAGVAAILLAMPAIAGGNKARSPSAALNEGLSAMNSGRYELAVPSLELVITSGSEDEAFLARYYLARILADTSNSRADHGRAYELYRGIADEFADMELDGDQRSRFVAKSLVAVAQYTRRGLAEVGLPADPERAAQIFNYAASMFSDEDAQFELAKMQLRGEGVERDVSLAKHWFAILSQKGHSGAQAFLADLYWHGKYMDADQVKAMALISVAAVNAPASERVWIEDIYQKIYCGAGEGVRKQATGLVAEWRDRYGRKIDGRAESAAIDTEAVRACQNGERVGPASTLAERRLPVTTPIKPAAGEEPKAGRTVAHTEVTPEGSPSIGPAGRNAPGAGGAGLGFMQGSAGGPGLGFR